MQRLAPALLSLLLLCGFGGCSDDAEQPVSDAAPPVDTSADLQADATPADAALPDAPPPATCAPGARSGKAGDTDGLLTGKSVKFNVRVPTTYDPLKGHPLIVVYAAAGGDPTTMEAFTKLTAPANQAGYIVAYVDHVTPNAGSAVDDIARVPEQIATQWCIDERRVFLTGHSDGASVIYVMLARKTAKIWPAAIAPSAAGLSAQSFAQVPCYPKPLPVMVLHSKNDTLFPGYGADARDWWVTCSGCSATAGAATADGCLPYPGCKNKVELQYCEGSGSHGTWPPLNASMLAFFGRY